MILRELFVKLGLDVDAQAFAKGQLAVEGVKFALGKVVSVAQETVAKFVDAVKGTAEFADEVDGLAQQAGVSTDSLQRLGKAAAVEGVGLEDLTHSLVILSRSMGAAKTGSEESATAFKKLGVRVTDETGKLRTSDVVFADLAEKFSKMPDGVEKTTTALKLFGRSGAGMIQVLNNGREGIEQFSQARVMTPEQIAAGKQLNIVLRQLATFATKLWREALSPLLPRMLGLAKAVLAWRKANGELMRQRLEWLFEKLLLGATMLWHVFQAGIKIGGFLADQWKQLGATGTTLAIVAGVIAAAWLLAAFPVVALGLAIATLVAVIEDVYVWTQGGKSLVGDLFKKWEQFGEKWLSSERPGGDPWWLVAIKAFVNMVMNFDTVWQDAIDEWKQIVQPFFDWLDNLWQKATAPLRYIGIRAGKTGEETGEGFDPGDPSKKKPGTNLPGFKFRSDLGSFHPDVASPAPAIVPAGGRPSVSNHVGKVEFNIHPQPGQSPKQIADAVDAKVREFFDGQLEAAGAAAGG